MRCIILFVRAVQRFLRAGPNIISILKDGEETNIREETEIGNQSWFIFEMFYLED